MEDGVKEEPVHRKEPAFLAKAGWVKKAAGRVLASYKDRYVHVEKTEILVYEHEDLKNCLERLDLENYDKCHELKSTFSKKHRLILIRSSRPGNKVHDVKFQAQTAEEKEAWIKALLDGINRAKNKVFDEVTVDDSSNLEHVTRSRPKGNRNRRPPTRIHMKEVADVSSDGILRLDLDLEDAMMPNGTHHSSVDGTQTPKEAVKVPSVGEWEAPTEPEVKKVIKPPMPPTKEAKPCAIPEEEPVQEEVPLKKILKPPMPPSKEAKPCAPSMEEATEEAEKTPEKSPDVTKKTAPPPTPPNKPTSTGSMSNLAEASLSEANSHPPTPPSKEKKPSIPAVEPDHEVQHEIKENEENKEATTAEISEEDLSTSEQDLPDVTDDKPKSTELSEDDSEEVRISHKASDDESQVPTPLLTLQEANPPETQHADDNTTTLEANKEQGPTELPQTDSDTSAGSLRKSEVPSIVVCLNDSLSLSPLLCHSDKKKKSEEKSVDSGQHSDDDSEASGNEDPLLASTVALRGSRPSLDASEDDVQIPVGSEPQVQPKPQVRPKVLTSPPKPSSKAKSASIGDLISPEVQSRPSGGDGASGDDIGKLETEVALEMEKTRELLSKVSQSQAAASGNSEGEPEDLLTEAMEKLKKADHVLKEVNKLKLVKTTSDRKSW